MNDAPNSFVWEIGHESVFTGKGALCVPGETGCDSYEATQWAGTAPIQIKSVTFGDGSQADQWAAVSDVGGKAEVLASCSVYGGAFCIYPYTLGKSGFHYGVDFPRYGQGFRAGRAVYPNTAMRRPLWAEQHILLDGSEIKIWQANTSGYRGACSKEESLTT